MPFRRRRVQAAAPTAETALAAAWLTRMQDDVRTLTPAELPAVVAARTTYADVVASLPLRAMVGSSPARRQSPLVTRPNPDEPLWQTLHGIVMDLTGPGTAFLMPTAWGADDRPVALMALPADTCGTVLDELGRVQTVTWQGRKLDPRAGDVVLVPWQAPKPGALGQSPLQSCRTVLEGVCALVAWQASFYESGWPSMLIKSGRRLTDDQAAEAKARVTYRWRRTMLPAVIDDGNDVQVVVDAARQAQLVEGHDWATGEVARAYLMPPSLINARAGDSLTYATTEGEYRRWLAMGLGAMLARLESAFTDLLPRGQVARFDTSRLLRSDFAERVAAYSTASGGAAWLTVSEIRSAEGLPPLTMDEPAADPAVDLGGI